MTRAGRHVAAFDVDGTLVRGDTLVPFLAKLVGHRRLGIALASLAPSLIAISAGRGDRDATKLRLLARLLRGRNASILTEAGEAFAGEVVAKRMHDEVAVRLEWHRAHRHELVMVSASLTAYLRPLADRLDFDAVVASELEVDGEGKLTGGLVQQNVRAAEKLRRLREHLGDRDIELWAYGNSKDDEPMLEIADHAFMVRRGGVITAWGEGPSDED